MLTIIDLHQEQELSSAEMGNVAGGTMEQALSLLGTAFKFFKEAGFDAASQACGQAAEQLVDSQPIVTPIQ
jgi:hypothetical protein